VTILWWGGVQSCCMYTLFNPLKYGHIIKFPLYISVTWQLCVSISMYVMLCVSVQLYCHHVWAELLVYHIGVVPKFNTVLLNDGGIAVPRRVAVCMDILVHNVVKCKKCSGNWIIWTTTLRTKFLFMII